MQGACFPLAAHALTPAATLPTFLATGEMHHQALLTVNGQPSTVNAHALACARNLSPAVLIDLEHL